jgi:chromosome segregation ATPase
MTSHELPSTYPSWQSYADAIAMQLTDNQDNLKTHQLQLEAVLAKRADARFLLESLPANRQNLWERLRLQRLLSGTEGTQPMLEERMRRIQARIDLWEGKQASFDHEALKAERRLANARNRVGKLPDVASRLENTVALGQ